MELLDKGKSEPSKTFCEHESIKTVRIDGWGSEWNYLIWNLIPQKLKVLKNSHPAIADLLLIGIYQIGCNARGSGMAHQVLWRSK